MGRTVRGRVAVKLYRNREDRPAVTSPDRHGVVEDLHHRRLIRCRLQPWSRRCETHYGGRGAFDSGIGQSVAESRRELHEVVAVDRQDGSVPPELDSVAEIRDRRAVHALYDGRVDR